MIPHKLLGPNADKIWPYSATLEITDRLEFLDETSKLFEYPSWNSAFYIDGDRLMVMVGFSSEEDLTMFLIKYGAELNK